MRKKNHIMYRQHPRMGWLVWVPDEHGMVASGDRVCVDVRHPRKPETRTLIGPVERFDRGMLWRTVRT